MFHSRAAYIFVLILLHSVLNCERAPFHADAQHDNPIHVHELITTAHYDQNDDGSSVLHVDIHSHHYCHSGNSYKVNACITHNGLIQSDTPDYQSIVSPPLTPPPSSLFYS